MAAVAAGDAKMRAEGELARVKDALVVAKKAKRKAEAKVEVEAEVARPEVEQTSLMLEIGAVKDEVSSLQSQAGKDKAAMEEDYQKALKLIFTYGYRCWMFKHNIYGDQPEVPEGIPDSSDPLPQKFFVNPKCSLVLATLRPQ